MRPGKSIVMSSYHLYLSLWKAEVHIAITDLEAMILLHIAVAYFA